MNETESVITSFAEDVSTAVSRVSELWLYSHIIDDDRRLNAERLEAAFYSGRTATPEPVQKVPEVTQDDDTALLMRLLQNPEMSALLKTLAKNL